MADKNYMKRFEELNREYDEIKVKLASAEAQRKILKEDYIKGKNELEENYNISYSKTSELVEIKKELEKELEDILDYIEGKLKEIREKESDDLEELDVESTEADTLDDLVDLDDI